ncbi:MAG: dockerin type I repeat-containing protein, partial [Candidatus Avispirillum sp.]
FTWDENPLTVWEGTETNSVTLHNDANNPSKTDEYANLMWDENYESILIRVYVRARVAEDTLTVRYFDRNSGDTEFYNYTIAVESGTTFDAGIGLDKTSETSWKGPLDNGTVVGLYVTNTVSADLSTMPAIGAEYRYSSYTCVEVIRSDDGKTVNLYYTFNNAHYFVVDFDRPVSLRSSDLGLDGGGWDSVTVSEGQFGTATIGLGDPLVYTLNKVMTSAERLTITLGSKGEDENGNEKWDYVNHYVYYIPATSVYYEESMMSYTGFSDVGTSTVANLTLEKGGEKINNYGYDPNYSTSAAGASNGTYLTSSTADSVASFGFTGTGVDIYANTTTGSGALMVTLKSGGAVKKLYFVDTHMQNGDGYYLTSSQNVIAYNVPVVSIRGLDHGEYTVEITHIESTSAGAVNAVQLDGFRVFNTISGDTSVNTYASDGELNPTYTELRDEILKAVVPDTVMGTSQYAKSIAQNVLSQVYSPSETGKITVPTAVYIAGDGTTGVLDSQAKVQDLLDNGPKNEVYVYAGDSVTFTTAEAFQIGMKSLEAPTTVTVTVGDTTEMDSVALASVDMYYSVSAGTVTITNNGSGILAITKLKFTSGTTAESALKSVNVQSLTTALTAVGYENDGSAVEYSSGDISGDGRVNGVDTYMLKSVLSGSSSATALETAAADINGDGTVNGIDTNLIKRIIVGSYNG